jgi:hypothetical protein
VLLSDVLGYHGAWLETHMYDQIVCCSGGAGDVISVAEFMISVGVHDVIVGTGLTRHIFDQIVRLSGCLLL